MTTTTADDCAANAGPGTSDPTTEVPAPARITDPAALPPPRRSRKATEFPAAQLLRPGLLRPGTSVKGRLSERIGVVMPYDVRPYTEGFPVMFAGVWERCCLDDLAPV
jgi:hypothetical protein